MSSHWPLWARIGPLLAALVWTLATPLAHATVLEPPQVLMLTAADAAPPGADRPWQPEHCPTSGATRVPRCHPR